MRCLLLALVSMGLAAPQALAQAPRTLDRDLDPVVLDASAVPGLPGTDPAEWVAFRYAGGWEQVPVQVDERAEVSFSQVYNQPVPAPTTLAYTDPTTYTGADPDPTLDGDDEVVLMARDSGDQAGAGVVEPLGVVAGSGLELEVVDPLTGNVGFFYLFLNDGSLAQGAGVDYVSYTFNLLAGPYIPMYDTMSGPNPEDSVVSGEAYRTHFSNRSIRDELNLYAGGASGVDILDRHRNLFAPGMCGRSEDTFSAGEGAFFANIDGPVRGIRSYMGANSGPLTERRHFFYAARHDVRTILRVHAIPSVLDIYDYEPEASGMTWFSEHTPAGVSIDGSPDAVAPDAPSWELVTGAQGSLSISAIVTTDIPGLVPQAYYSDNVVPPEQQCTGDDYEYGASGLFFNDPIPNTDPMGQPPVYSFVADRVVYCLAPDQTPAVAEQRDLEARNPIRLAAVSPWSGSPSCQQPLIQPIALLRALKAGTDVALSWTPDVQADAYNVYGVDEAVLIPEARLGGSGSLLADCDGVALAGCTDATGMGADPRRFYQVRGSCLGSEALE